MFCKIHNYGSNGFLSGDNKLEVIVVGICIGVILGTVLAVVYKSITSAFIKQLISKEIFTKEAAIKIESLDFCGKWFIKNELKHEQTPLRKYVRITNEEDVTLKKKGKGTPKIDVKNALFYLPEENKTSAEFRYSGVNKPVASIVITIILTVAMGLFTLFAAPELIQMLENFLNSLE